MTEQQRQKPRHSFGSVLLEFLGSMNLAITLLMVIAVASVIGTVLQQNEPYNNYVMKFGPFWFEVYRTLGLYQVYSATWFLILLGFLLISTSVCVYRNTPSIIRDMRQFRLDVQAKSLRSFHHQDEWETSVPAQQALQSVNTRLKKLGYRSRIKSHDGHTVLAGMKGRSGRLGYIFSHVSIVVICLGGLLDGNIGLKIGELRGNIAVETRDLPINQVPAESLLAANSTSFRGSVNIPEGARANFVFLGMRDGYLVQELPFTIELEDFRIEHYPSGQPKSYESTLIIHDDELDEPLRKVIAVNHPLIYKDHAIYQASFADGGSKLDIAAWSMDHPGVDPLPIRAEVGSNVQLNTPRGPYMLELIDFKRFNVFPNEDAGSDGVDSSPYRNFGASVIFKMRAADGEAREYINYQSPVLLDGRYFYLTGVRENTNEDYRYMHIPLDEKGRVDRFMEMLAMARNPDVLERIARRQAENDPSLSEDAGMQDQFAVAAASLVRVFIERGIDAVVEQTERLVPEGERSSVLTSYIGIIQGVLGTIYLDMLAADGHDMSEISEQQANFFDDFFTAASLIAPYGSPLYLELKQFEHVEASGLQITKAPGQNIVYFGSAMLMLGLLLMFYVHHRRLWLMVSEKNGKTEILFAASGHRQRSDFDREFDFLKDDLRRVTGATPTQSE